MTSKKVLILNGSPRAGGNTSILADHVKNGVEQAGGEAEIIYLHGLDISPCDACDACQGIDIDCIVEDDMQKLFPKIHEAGAIVYASPIYWFTVSAQLKLFIDRCYGMGIGSNQGLYEYPLSGKKMGVALVYEGEDPFDSGAINAIRSFQDMFRYISAELVGIVYGQALNRGEIRKRADVLENATELGEKLVSVL